MSLFFYAAKQRSSRFSTVGELEELLKEVNTQIPQEVIPVLREQQNDHRSFRNFFIFCINIYLTP